MMMKRRKQNARFIHNDLVVLLLLYQLSILAKLIINSIQKQLIVYRPKMTKPQNIVGTKLGKKSMKG